MLSCSPRLLLSHTRDLRPRPQLPLRSPRRARSLRIHLSHAVRVPTEPLARGESFPAAAGASSLLRVRVTATSIARARRCFLPRSLFHVECLPYWISNSLSREIASEMTAKYRSPRLIFHQLLWCSQSGGSAPAL